MFNFNEKFFSVKFAYNSELVNKIITIIKFSDDDKRVSSFSTLLFKMMFNIVKKNISNYRNLSINSPIEQIPSFDELISDCYIILINCVNNYDVKKSNNFYFYYNKALSRRFFRDFTKELKHNDSSNRISGDTIVNDINFSTTSNLDTIDIIIKNYKLTPIEVELCYCRINGGGVKDFIRKNNITITAYNKILKSIKEKLNEIKNE